MPQKCRHRRIAVYRLGVGQTAIYYLSWCTVRFLFRLLETTQRPGLFWITETMSESLIIVQLTCPLLSVTQTRCPETPNSPGHLHVCMFTVVEPRLSGVKAKVILQTNEWQWHICTHTHTHCRPANKRQKKKLDQGLTLHCNTMLDPRQHHSALRVQANLAPTALGQLYLPLTLTLSL